jgi:hypothetical protein
MATLDSIRQEALRINDSVNQMATQQGKATQTFDSAGNRTMTPAQPIAANNVPASVLSAPQQPELTIPQTNVPQVNAGAAIASAEQMTGTIQQQEAQRMEAQASQAGARLSDSERAIREAVGIIGTEGRARTQLEESAGMTQMKEQLNQLSNQLFNQTAALRQFDVDNVNTIEQMRVDASKRDITKRTFGAMSAEAGIQMAVQRANMVGELYATQSSVQLMQGNIQLATENIDKALNSIYEPKRQELQMEMMFFQRNAQLFDAAENRAANARMEVIRQEQATIDRAIVNADTAVATGYASPEEIQKLVSLAGNPEAQNQLSQQIIGRAQRAEVQARNAQIAASRSNAAWSQRAQAYNLAMNGDPMAIEFLGFDPRQSSMSVQDTFNYINETMEDDAILTSIEKALNVSNATLNASTGVVKSAFGTALLTRGLPAAGAGAAVGSVVPVAGTIKGGAVGLIGGTAVGFTQIANEKKDLMGALGHLANTAAFVKLREYREAGISFGQLTEAERIAIGRSASALFAVLDVKNDGTVAGVNASPQEFQRLLQAYQKDVESKKEQKRVIYSGLTPIDASFIDSL